MKTDSGATVLDTSSDAEMAELFSVVHRTYGYDFSHYQRPFLDRRLRKLAAGAQVEGGMVELISRIGAEPQLMAQLLDSLALAVTEMFRDPEFFQSLRVQVLPVLQTYPFVRIWVAGCATGEEAYSLAILLEEEGLAGKYQIYATDIHAGSLERARSGVIPVEAMRLNTRNYQRAGGKSAFSDYYHSSSGGQSLIRSQWRESIVFSRHNLVSDARFNEFNLILCRNVMIYFDKQLHARVHELFYDSLANFGFLGLGSRESLRFSPRYDDYEVVNGSTRLYRRIR